MLEGSRKSTRPLLLAAATTLACALLLASASGVWASASGIKAAIVKSSQKIDVAEGHLLTAIGEYTSSKGPGQVEAALNASLEVIGTLKDEVSHQSARSPQVAGARAEIERGLQLIIDGYNNLYSAFELSAASPGAATTEVQKAKALVKKGQLDLRAGVLLLG